MEGSRTYFGIQFVVVGRNGVWGLLPPFPESGPDRGKIYSWRFGLGPIEVKKWGRSVDWRLTKKHGGG